MMLCLVPPWIEPTVTTAGSMGFTDGQGAFRLEQLAPGQHNFAALDPTGAHQPIQQGAVVAADSATPVTLALTPAAPVQASFEVTLPSDTPAGAIVRVIGNVRGLGPASAELEFEERPNEAVMVLAADKTEPGAFNLPLYLAFADPMYSPGLLLSDSLHRGFRFKIMDVDHTEGNRTITLDAPERLYDIAALLRDTHRYVIESIWSRRYADEQAAAVSTSRLRNIAGKYVGKDDPVAVVRVQRIFPATEEFGPPFAVAQYVAGDTRGSHNLPLMPVPINTPASTYFCCPMVSALGFSVHDARLTAVTDLFADPFWQHVRDQAAAKAMDMRRQGFFGPAMLPMSELEYGGIVTKLAGLDQEFVVNGAEAAVGVTKSGD